MKIYISYYKLEVLFKYVNELFLHFNIIIFKKNLSSDITSYKIKHNIQNINKYNIIIYYLHFILKMHISYCIS